MKLRSLAFAGYRSFAARSPSAPDRPLQRLDLAPLTILLGKNNSGKSTAARLLHHVLLALGSDGKDPFPMAGEGRRFARSFRDLQHGQAFFNPLDLEIELASDEGDQLAVAAQLIQLRDNDDDRPPFIQKLTFAGQHFDVGQETAGLLPAIPEARPWRDGARSLLRASCHLGPVREPIRDLYEVAPGAPTSSGPRDHEAVAQLLLSDAELRAAVGEWSAANLEGWRVDVQQTLNVFRLVARRPGRESNLADSGQGIQQVLPVAVLCHWRSLGRGATPFLDVVEQPELHLHDAAHAALGDLLLQAVSRGQGTLVVETHSEPLVLRIRRRIAEGKISVKDVAIVYVEDSPDGSLLRPIPVRPDGEVEWWPEGVFSESFLEVKAIRRAQRAHGGT